MTKANKLFQLIQDDNQNSQLKTTMSTVDPSVDQNFELSNYYDYR